MDCQCDRVCDRVVRMDKFHNHLSQLYLFAGYNRMSCCGIQHFMLSQLIFQKPQCQQCPEYGYVNLLENIGQCADMILVSVR